jgi:soluble P-type ATPase
VSPWFKKWGLRGFTSASELVDGKVRIADHGILDKVTALEQFPGNLTTMAGDGANDAGIVRAADFGIAVQLIHTVPALLLSSADCVVNDERTLCRILSRL